MRARVCGRLSRTVRTVPRCRSSSNIWIPGAWCWRSKASPEGKAFLAELRSYLDEFGWRSDGIYEIGDATWREDPTIPLNTIQGYVRLGDEHNPELSPERASERRNELVRALADWRATPRSCSNSTC